MKTDEGQLVYRVPDVARRGEIPPRKWGRRVVIIPSELQAHLLTLRVGGKGAA